MEERKLWNNELEKLFSAYCGEKIGSRQYLSSHGSDRVIIRIRANRRRTAIGIIHDDIKENKAFIEFGRHFRKCKLNVPEIYGVSNDLSCYLLKDLGNRTLFEEINEIRSSESELFFEKKVNKYYKKAIKSLLRFQLDAGRTVPYKYCCQYGEFSGDNIDFDLNYFKKRFLENFYKGKINNNKLTQDLSNLKSKLLELPRKYFLYRDFQSRNIMIKNYKLYFIDFQSGRKGALQYDLASLLFDARADVPQHIREDLLDYYIKEANRIIPLDGEKFKEYFWYFAVVRILQAMGAYGYLGIVKGKKNFLESIPFALKNINLILAEKIRPGSLDYLKEIFINLKNIKSIGKLKH
ncbi:MAG: aminoglycoside phosphotransferase family protein [Ignavibacteria bacterium]